MPAAAHPLQQQDSRCSAATGGAGTSLGSPGGSGRLPGDWPCPSVGTWAPGPPGLEGQPEAGRAEVPPWAEGPHASLVLGVTEAGTRGPGAPVCAGHPSTRSWGRVRHLGP